MNPMNPMNSMNHPMSYHPMQQMSYAQPAQQPYVAFSGMPQHNPVAIKSRLFVPNTIVGALIGTKGANIRNMMHMTGAIIHVEGGPEPKKEPSDGGSTHARDPTTPVATTSATEENTVAEANSRVEGDAEPALELTKEPSSVETEDAKEVSQSTSVATASTSEEKTAPIGLANMTDMSDAINQAEGETKKESTDEGSSSIKEPENPPSTPVTSTFTASDGKAPTGVNSDKNLRPVYLSGYDFQVYRAEFWIFQRIAESMHIFIDELTLTAEVIVPSRIVGRIIGKGGQNIRELQKITHATVKVPEQPKSGNAWQLPIETPVRVIGSFFSLQAVQTRFAALIAESEHREYAA